MSQTASLIILTYNNLDTTRLCLDSIFEKTAYPDFEVVLVDNASQDQTPAYLTDLAEARPNVHLILNRENVGFAAGNNQGAAAAQGDILVFLNNDVVVTPGWLTTLISHLQADDVGMVGPVTNNSGNQSQIPVTYQNLADLDAFAAAHTAANQGNVYEIPMLAFHCVAIRREVFDEVGPLDERFGQGMFEDDDYALRLREKGYRLLCAEDAFIHHWGSASFSKLAMGRYWQLFKANLDKFEEKWGRRWQPHPHRQEILAEQLRGFLEGSIWLAESLNEEQSRAAAMEKELENIYRSDAWVLAQKFLTSRDQIVPEGSRRHQFLQAGLSLVRRRQIGETLNRLRLALTGSPGPARGAAVTETLATTAPTDLDTQHTPYQRRARPLVSVILPVYNHADMLAQAAKSVLDSTYFRLELIILDDGSTDEVEPVLQSLLADPRVRVYRQSNQKLPRALTHAHQFAQGDFITWTSADNLFAPNALEVMVESLLAHPAAVLVYADVAIIDEGGRFILDGSYRPQNLDPEQKEILRLHRSPLPLGYELDNYINACFLYRRAASEALEGQFADDLRGYEDYDFWLRLQKCGELQHVNNQEPLYFYRVHSRTMSADLLTKERMAHLDRGEQLIAYEADRRAFSEQAWSLVFDETLPVETRAELQALAEQVPRAGASNSDKRLVFRPPHDSVAKGVEVQVGTQGWELVWEGLEGRAEQRLPLWRGIRIHPLARKARELLVDENVIPQAGNRLVVGCHLALKNLPVDIEACRRLMAKNAWATFIFLDVPDEADPELSEKLTGGIDNAFYLGTQPVGEPYRLYARCTALWIPPLRDRPSKWVHLYRAHLALAYAIGRPLLAPRGFPVTPAPYQFHYFTNERLDILSGLAKEPIDHYLLDLYLEKWAPPAQLAQLTRYADPLLQDRLGTRPDFRQEAPPKTPAVPWPSPEITVPTPLKCGLVVNYLDKGGLERQVAHLARRLPDHGVETFVLCLYEGGTTAEALEADGVRMYVAGGQPAMAREIIKKEAPGVVNTQMTDQFFLEMARDLGIPVVETIQNTYVWFSRETWREEQARSRYFTHAIAVSALAREYYMKGNPLYNPDWMSVGPNAIDPATLTTAGRARAREELGLPEEAFLFLMLASYDGRKNQLATLTAFDRVARAHPEALFWFAGNVVDARYHERVRTYHEELKLGDRVRLFAFRDDISRLLAAADAFVLNSFFEGWSLAATEALMLGVPLIHSDCGSGRELVGDGQERGLLIPNPGSDPIDLTWQTVNLTMGQKQQRNTAALAQAMSAMLADRAQWAARRPEIQDHARQAFTIENAVRRYTEIFHQVTFERHKK